MRTLVLMRHAKAERTSASGEDFDRALTERGRADARLMGAVLARAGVKPDTALVSAAARTRETWEEASQSFGDVDVSFEPGLYHAGPGALRRALEAAEERAGALILVGHNPGLHELAVDLTIEGAAAPSELEQVTARFPTAAAAVFRMDAGGRPMFDGLYLPETHGGGGE